MQHIDVKMLGAFEVRRAGEPIQGHEWGRQKNRLLLKYFLAHRGLPITQEQLIEVIYAERPSMALSRNLLGRISEVRRIVEPDLERGNRSSFIVRVNQGTYLFPVDAPCTTDVDAFDDAMRQGGNLFAREDWKPALHAYERALELYAGDFLAEDLYEEWTTPLRERLSAQYREALINAGTCRIELGAYQDAIRAFDRAIELDRADQSAYRGKIEALYHMFDLNRALQTFEELEEVLEEEGYDPDPETHALRRALLSGSLERKTPVPPHNLQKPATPFFGREGEISSLLQELSDPANRVITLLGTGGIGKTRLAVETAFRCLSSFSDGVYFVSVPHDASTAQLISAIVSAVGISLQAQQDAKQQILTALRDKSILLLIDNGEHALKAVGVLEEIVQSTSVRVLAMSRERLHVAGELIIEVHGLDYWQDEVTGQDAGVQSLAGYSATQLFADRMHRVNHEFTLCEATARDVARICRFAGGMPLALELAASWGRALSCREIADGIEESLTFLDGGADTSSEQRSVRAIFDHTWSLLTPDEQRIFAALSVFVGGMSPDAALKVANAPLSTIVSLRDKALVQRADSDRYVIHELLRQFAVEKLSGDPDLEQSAHEAHARYFCDLAASSFTALHNSEQNSTLARLQPDAENLQAAWRWLVEHRRVNGVASMMDGYARFLDLKTRWQEWSGLLAEAIQRFRGADPKADPWDARRTLGRLLVMYAVANLSVGTPAEAGKALDESMAIAQDTGDALLEGLSLSGLGAVYQMNGRHEESERALRQSLELLKATATDPDVARTLSKLGVTLRLQGKSDEAEAIFLECLNIYRRLGDPTETTGALANLATMYGAQGKLDEAIRYFEEGLELAKETGHRHLMLVCTMNLGFIAYIRKEYATAKSRYLEAWKIAKEIGHQEGQIFVRYYLALVCPHTGDLDNAEGYIRDGMKQTIELQATASTLRFVYALGRLQQMKGRLTDAIALFSFALGHEATSVPTRNDIGTDMAQIEASLTEAEVAAAKERAKSLSLEEIWTWIRKE